MSNAGQIGYDQIEAMFEIQSGLNFKSYSEEWLAKGKTQEFDYEAAAGQEVGEFMESLPVSWWTGATLDRKNCVTELVDALHFIMSQGIVDEDGNVKNAVESSFAAYAFELQLHVGASSTGAQPTNLTVKRDAKKLVALLYLNNDPQHKDMAGLYHRAFWRLCFSFDVSLDLLYARYLAKSTLNKFRVENGYKKKQYAKLWDFHVAVPYSENVRPASDFPIKEDNYYLSTWVDEQIETGVVPSADSVYAWLTDTYSKVTNKPAV